MTAAGSNRFARGTSRVPDLLFRFGTRIFAFVVVGVLIRVGGAGRTASLA